MKKAISLPLIALVTACAVAPAAETTLLDQRVELYAAPTDVAGDAWTIRPSDYLIDRPLHVTRFVSADGAAIDLDATIPAGGGITLPIAAADRVIDGSGLASIEGWY
jgi:hypothetical protein